MAGAAGTIDTLSENGLLIPERSRGSTWARRIRVDPNPHRNDWGSQGTSPRRTSLYGRLPVDLSTAGELALQLGLRHVQHGRATVTTGAWLGRAFELGDKLPHLRQ